MVAATDRGDNCRMMHAMPTTPFATHSASPSRTAQRMRTAGLVCVFLWFLIGGVAHFALIDLMVRIVPPFVPWPREVVLFTGVLELLGAAALVPRSTRRWAGIGLFLLTLAVTPANVYMLQQAQAFDVPYWVLVARLPLQVGLLALIAWAAVRKPQAG
jgi:uncharacterized membrane protein